MSAENVTLGPDAKIDFAGLPFGSVSGRLRVIRDVVKRTDTESSAIRAKASSLRQIEVNIVAQQADDEGYHIAPLLLTTGESLSVRIWPFGRTHPDGPYDIPQLIVRSYESDWTVDGAPVQRVTIDGESDDDVFLPGEP